MSEQQVLRLEGEDAFRAMANPLRRQIIQVLAAEDLGAKEIADRLSVSPTLLYRHLDVLLETKLIEVASTELRRGLETRIFRGKPIPQEEAGDIAAGPEGFQRLGAAQIRIQIPIDQVHAILHALVVKVQESIDALGEEVVVTLSIDRDSSLGPRD